MLRRICLSRISNGLPRRLSAMLLAAMFIITSSLPSFAADKLPVRVSLFSWPGYAFWFLAKEKDLVPEIDLQVQIIEDPYKAFALMAGNQLDVISSTAEYAPLAAAEGNPVRLVAYTNPSYGTDKIIVRPEIKSAADLKGKKVAVLEGGLTQIFMGKWLEENGVSIKDVTFTNVIMDAAVAAIVGGDVAAGEFWEPFGKNVLEALPGAKVMATSDTPFWAKTGLLADAMYMRDGFVKENGKAAELAMKAYFEAVKYWRANPKEANDIIAKALKFKLEDVVSVIGDDGKPKKGGIIAYGLKDSSRFMGLSEGDPQLGQTNGQITDHFALTSEWWVKFGFIKKTPDFAAGVSLEPMKSLIASGYMSE